MRPTSPEAYPKASPKWNPEQGRIQTKPGEVQPEAFADAWICSGLGEFRPGGFASSTGPSGFSASRVRFCYWARGSPGARAHRVRLVGPVPCGTCAFRASASHVMPVPLVLVFASDESLSGGYLLGPQRTLHELAKDPKRAVCGPYRAVGWLRRAMQSVVALLRFCALRALWLFYDASLQPARFLNQKISDLQNLSTCRISSRGSCPGPNRRTEPTP